MSTSIAPTTTSMAPVTTAASVSYTTSDCSTPPVTFALLCDVYELIEENHVDAPLDPAALAAGAALGIDSHQASDSGAPAPESFVCAIPDPAFESACSTLASRVESAEVDLTGAVEAGVASMIQLSLDPFTYYIPPELSRAITEDGVVSAVGLLLRITDPAGSLCTLVASNCILEVAMALPDGPAAQAGIEAGDIITSISGEPIDGLALVDVAEALDGEPGTSVSIALQRGDQSLDFVLERSELAQVPFDVDVPRSGTGYLRIPDFSPATASFVRVALQSLTQSGVGEIVVDLRDNPGGFVDVVTLVASEFFTDGLVLRTLSPNGDLEYPVQPGGVASDVGLTVVVNGGSASASEILAGVLQERGRARVVGEPTFGKNTVQIAFPLRNDGQLRVTIARWVTPDGASVAQTGVIPDEIVAIPAEATTEELIELVSG